MTKTDLYGAAAVDLWHLRHAGTVIFAHAYFICAAARAGPLRPDLVFVITFRKIILRTEKNGLERRPSQFSTICAKIQVPKLNIYKVTVILRRKYPP